MNRRELLKSMIGLPVVVGLGMTATPTHTEKTVPKGVSFEDACEIARATLKDIIPKGKYAKYRGVTTIVEGSPVCWNDDGSVSICKQQ